MKIVKKVLPDDGQEVLESTKYTYIIKNTETQFCSRIIFVHRLFKIVLWKIYGINDMICNPILLWSNKMKKALSVFGSIFLLAIMMSCTTVTYSEKEGVMVTPEDLPDPEVAYFLITTEGQSGLVSTAIILKDSAGEKITIVSKKEEQYLLIKVKPETYTNDFSRWVWDALYWARSGSYNVNPSYKEPFLAEKNTVYYLGRFDSEYFKIEEGYEEVFRKEYPNFADVPVVVPYKK